MSDEIAYDVVVVGSGPGGGACAWGLAQQGASVLVLEAGPAYDPREDYRLDEADWELEAFPAKVQPHYSYGPMQPLEERWQHLRSWNRVRGKIYRGERRAVEGYQSVQGLGGTTLHFTGEAHRLHPQAMRMGSRFGVAADWPLTYEELEPYYQQAERVVGVAGPKSDPSRPRSRPYPLPAHPFSYATQRLARGFAELGWDWIPNPVAALSEPYRGRPPCNYCANCNRGCPRLDKGSVDLTFIPEARETGRCRFRTGCTVTYLEAGQGDRVKAIRFLDEQGREQRLSARCVVLAGGAVETPRLLLHSTSPRAPEGLANESGQVGRNFMETLAWLSNALHPEDLGSHRGHPSDAISWAFNAPDAIDGVPGGCRFSPATPQSGLVGPVTYALRVVPGWGKAHKQAMREAFGRALGVASVGEFLPNQDSYIDLDPEQSGAGGVPLARIHSRLGASELKRLDFMARSCRRILEAAGAGERVEEYGTYDSLNATHVFGTCRMGADPETSVVDPWGRSHRWRNLFVADASVFPSTGGGESPSLTIEALALRTADHIAKRMLDRSV